MNNFIIHYFVALALLFSTATTLSAQDFYLPVSSKSEAAKVAYYEAMRLFADVRIPEARQQRVKALQADSTFFLCHVHRAMEAAGAQKYDFVATSVNKALALKIEGLNKAELVLRKLMVQWQQDPKTSPAKVMEELVAAYPKTPQAYEWAALSAANISGDATAALDYSLKLVALSPDFTSAYNTLGYVYMEKGEMEKAKAAFENQLRLAPKEANAYDSMGEYYLTVKDYAKSAEYYDKAVALGMEASKEGATKARGLMKQ